MLVNTQGATQQYKGHASYMQADCSSGSVALRLNNCSWRILFTSAAMLVSVVLIMFMSLSCLNKLMVEKPLPGPV